ncbi:hypothetical protein MCOR21_008647 [Pyricularia oryzae]|nr:hypothetical protein MCOR21_008647 [Pyricularia oryzae]KAI6497311.1 hypothetical protein MCOR11_004550 [Pyricularia oryzae]
MAIPPIPSSNAILSHESTTHGLDKHPRIGSQIHLQNTLQPTWKGSDPITRRLYVSLIHQSKKSQ